MDSSPCQACGKQVPFREELCPHCGHQGPPPNIKAASTAEEQQALDRRYKAALRDAESRGSRQVIEEFETAVRGSKAVMARRATEVSRLLASSKGLFTTYYNLLDGEVHLPYGDKWDELRELADTKLFPG